MSDNLQGPMQSAFSRVLPKIAPPAAGTFKAVAPTSKGRQVYNAMVATPRQTVRFYAGATGLAYGNTYNHLVRMREAGFAGQTASDSTSLTAAKLWSATGQWDEDAWMDAIHPGKDSPSKPARPALVPAPARVVPAPTVTAAGGGSAFQVPEADMMGYRLAEPKPAAIDLDKLTIGEARKLYDALKKLFG
jgi:hypothetical protein